MLENGCLLLASQLLQCGQQQRNEKEEMAPQTPSTIVLSSIQTDRKKTGKWILKGKQPRLTFPFLRVPCRYRVKQYRSSDKQQKKQGQGHQQLRTSFPKPKK